MYQIHTGRAPQYLAHCVQLIAESSRRTGLRSADTADYIKLNLVNVASLTLVQLPGIPHLTVLSLYHWHQQAPRFIFLNSSIAPRVLTSISRPL